MPPELFGICLDLGAGKPGAIVALAEVWKQRTQTDFLAVSMILGLNQFRGNAIWYGYKDYCKEDANRFADAVIAKDPDMFDFIRLSREQWG